MNTVCKIACAVAASAIVSIHPTFAQKPSKEFKENIPLDSIELSDPAILADNSSSMYYMTGTGGKLWKSSDLRLWSGSHDMGGRTA